MNKYDICVDFDGTCVTHEFPKIGKDIGAVPVLKRLVENGHPDIQDVTGNFIDDAVDWFKQNDITLYGIQSNPTQKTWTNSPKAYGGLYIADVALGCPLIFPTVGRPYVDWESVEIYLELQGLI